MDAIPQQHMPGADERLAEAARTVHEAPLRKTPTEIIADVLSEFGAEYQIVSEEFAWVAIRYPTPTRTDVLVGHDAAELLAKLRAERDGTDAD